MKGVVEVYYGDKLIDSGSNMIMDNTGELIVDMLTAVRELTSIEVASSILDTSNYTVRAASLGKDAAGYQHHAHSDLLGLGDNIIRVISYEDTTVSSYHTSAFGIATNTAILPEAPHPKMQRLETKSTAISGTHDYGHNVNRLGLSLDDRKFGCYAPSGEFTVYIVSGPVDPGDADQKVIASATITNNDGQNSFSNPAVIDTRGFIMNIVNSMVDGSALEEQQVYKGLLLSCDDEWFNNSLQIRFVLGITPEDLIVLNAYGGVYNIGLWGIDLKKMVAKGMLPPYNLEASEDMEYRLLARKTFTRDITYYKDNESNAGLDSVNSVLKFVWRWVFK